MYASYLLVWFPPCCNDIHALLALWNESCTFLSPGSSALFIFRLALRPKKRRCCKRLLRITQGGSEGAAREQSGNLENQSWSRYAPVIAMSGYAACQAGVQLNGCDGDVTVCAYAGVLTVRVSQNLVKGLCLYMVAHARVTYDKHLRVTTLRCAEQAHACEDHFHSLCMSSTCA